MGSIDPTDVSAVRGICIKCCACVKGCPTGAKYFDDAGYLYHRYELEAQYARPVENEVFINVLHKKPAFSGKPVFPYSFTMDRSWRRSWIS